jgi:DNA ligase (NAD+)
MDIRGLSYARIQQLIDAGLVQDVADIYSVTHDQLVALDRFADKSATALIDAIAASKAQPLSRLLFGLGIRHVGATAAELLARRFGTLDALMAGSVEEVEAVRGIGEIIARAVHHYFEDESARALIEKLRERGLNFTEPQSVAADGALSGKTVVITGTLPGLSRTEATTLIESAGGRVTSGVSKATSFVLAGENPGSKLEKANALGVEVIDEPELLRRIGR